MVELDENGTIREFYIYSNYLFHDFLPVCGRIIKQRLGIVATTF